jgi:hypothetical protein
MVGEDAAEEVVEDAGMAMAMRPAEGWRECEEERTMGETARRFEEVG